jgi:hypothetical protein
VSTVDVAMHIGELPSSPAERDTAAAPFHVSEETDESGRPTRVISRTRAGHYRIEYCDGTCVIVDARGERVWARGAVADVEDTATVPARPRARLRAAPARRELPARERGRHRDARACAFVGASGSGKSSIAAAFARAGFRAVSDDVTPVTEGGSIFTVHLPTRAFRLWPESVHGLFGDSSRLPPLVAGWDKRCLDLASPPYRFQSEPFAARGDLPARARMHEPAIEPVPPREAVMRIVAETYATYALDRQRRANEFDFVMRLVDRVAVRRLHRGTDFEGAARICELVAADFRR